MKRTAAGCVVGCLLLIAGVGGSGAGAAEDEWQVGGADRLNASQEDPAAEGPLELHRDYLERCARDAVVIVTSPPDWDKAARNRACLVTGLVIGLYAYDQSIQDWSQENRSDSADAMARVGRTVGDGRYLLPSLGAAYLYGRSRDDERLRRTALLALESFLVSGAFTQTLKLAGHRHRPSSGSPAHTWDGPSLSSHDQSFPSGHASAAFAVLTVVALEYDDRRAVPPLAYTMATVTALSRVYENHHWASDVLMGSAIGWFTARSIVALHSDDGRNAVTLVPVDNDDYAALSASFRF